MLHCIIAKTGGYHREAGRAARANNREPVEGDHDRNALKAVLGVGADRSRSLSTADATRNPETSDQTEHLVIRGELRSGYGKVLTPTAVAFIAGLERKFGAERRRLLARRADIQRRLDAGWKPDFLPETKEIRNGDWRVAPIPRDIQDRCIEITGHRSPKCGADTFALNQGAVAPPERKTRGPQAPPLRRYVG